MIAVSDIARRRIGYTLIACAAGLVVTHAWVSISIGETDDVADNILLGVVFIAVLALAMRAAPRNAAVWALLWGAFFGALSQVVVVIGAARTGFTTSDIEFGNVSVAPSSLDLVSALAINLSQWVWLPGAFLFLIHLVILFPGGQAGSLRWRWVAWGSGLAIAVWAGSVALATAPWVDTPFDQASDLFSILFLPIMATAAAALVHLIMRFRRSSGVERLQYKWIVWAASLNIVTTFGAFGWVPEIFGIGLGTLALAAIPASIGIAITKYRLYDIDVVISRTLVFVVLVGFITLVYASVVVGVGSLVGGSSLGWQIAATALVAVVFEPVRDRVQRWINRLVLGRRATPYEVLSDLTGRLAATEREEGLLDRMAARLAEGTGADRAIVWIGDDTRFRAAACEPDGDLPTEPGGDFETLPGTVVPIRHDGETLGALSVESRRGDALTPTEQRLVEDLAGSAGLLMRRLRLDADLERKADELAESRRRLVDAQDVERRRLERELDVGAQQQVLSLKVQLGLAEQQARSEGAETAASLIGQIAAETQDAIEQIQALAHGIYPPLLEAEGLSAAIDLLAEVAPVVVQVSTHVPRRYPLPVEGAIYFSVSEALTNAVKHGRPPIRVDVSDVAGELVFTVSDSGPGFDSDTVQRGAGLNNMSDRCDALGGSVTIDAAPGTHTTVLGRVPLGLGVMT